jgi:PBP1b-binding outer membrane lipoprotein LpoB
LDNCVHYEAKSLFPGHTVTHARDIGWRELSNGDLLAQAAKQFDVVVSVDKKMRYEHILTQLPIPVIELSSKFTRIDDLKLLSPHLESALRAAASHQFIAVHADGRIEALAPRMTGGL